MQELRDLARGDEISSFIVDPPNGLSTEYVQGVNLTIDAFWLRYYRANYGARTEESPTNTSFRMRRFISDRILDFSWRPTGWNAHCRARGYPSNSQPVIMQVLLRGSPEPAILSEAPASVGRYPIEYEFRGPCVAFQSAALRPGAKIGGANAGQDWSGTLGGFLKDSSTGSTYAVGCGHVFGAAGTEIRGGKGMQVVGDVRFVSLPPASSTEMKCNNRASPDAALDMAVAEIRPGISYQVAFEEVGALDKLTRIADMTSGDRVAFYRSSGKKNKLLLAKVGSLNIWREVNIEGIPHCMGDLFTIQPRQRQYIRSDLAKPGDSGTWVLSIDNDVLAWEGMIVGGDGPDVYCSFAENIFDQCVKVNPGLKMAF
jgi:hypothetical protein